MAATASPFSSAISMRNKRSARSAGAGGAIWRCRCRSRARRTAAMRTRSSRTARRSKHEIATAGDRQGEVQNRLTERSVEMKELRDRARRAAARAHIAARPALQHSRRACWRSATASATALGVRCRKPAVRRRADRGAPGRAGLGGRGRAAAARLCAVAAGAGRALRGSCAMGRRHASGRTPRLLPGAEARGRRARPTRCQVDVAEARYQGRFAFYDWLQRELDERFDHVCCASLDEFRREEKAITRTGQIKVGGRRHEKDDRSRIEDRANFVLGWSNAAKIAALEKAAGVLAARIQAAGAEIAKLQGELQRIAGEARPSAAAFRIHQLQRSRLANDRARDRPPAGGAPPARGRLGRSQDAESAARAPGSRGSTNPRRSWTRPQAISPVSMSAARRPSGKGQRPSADLQSLDEDRRVELSRSSRRCAPKRSASTS